MKIVWSPLALERVEEEHVLRQQEGLEEEW